MNVHSSPIAAVPCEMTAKANAEGRTFGRPNRFCNMEVIRDFCRGCIVDAAFPSGDPALGIAWERALRIERHSLVEIARRFEQWPDLHGSSPIYFAICEQYLQEHYPELMQRYVGAPDL